ncbi:MAG: STAS domain-containing protein [Armatimonadota bacterium]|nr:STAS domain-containing protein [Armatimonadota bacterium]
MDEVPFEVHVSRRERLLAVKVSGELDFANFSKLDAILRRELAEANVRLALDFSDVTFLDSEGLKVIVKAYRRIADAGGEISITGCSDTVGRLFDILGLRNVLGVTRRETG